MNRSRALEYYIFKGVLAILVAFGMIMLFSASSRISFYKYDSSSVIFLRHLTRMLAALILGIAAYRIDYQLIRKANAFFFFAALAVVIYPLLSKLAHPGSPPARWIAIGSFSFQTAEIARFALIIFISNYLAKHQENIRDLREGFMPVAVVMIGFISLLALAPDFSTAAILYLIFMVMIYAGGARLSHILSVSGIAAVVGLIYIRMADYRWARILSFFDPEANKKASYQVTQSLISLGNGGFFGQSLGASYGKNMYLPEAHTDFIFSIIGEEWGFLGTALTILLFVILFLSLYRLTERIHDIFARLVIFSTAFSILLYALVNAAVCVRIFPVTGLPMPFVSYSGSQLIVNSALLGIVFNILHQEKI